MCLMAKVDVVGIATRPKEQVREAVESRLREVKTSIEKVKKTPRDFEIEYKMSTKSFYKKHLDGELKENLDFMEWRASNEILDDLLE